MPPPHANVGIYLQLHQNCPHTVLSWVGWLLPISFTVRVKAALVKLKSSSTTAFMFFALYWKRVNVWQTNQNSHSACRRVDDEWKRTDSLSVQHLLGWKSEKSPSCFGRDAFNAEPHMKYEVMTYLTFHTSFHEQLEEKSKRPSHSTWFPRSLSLPDRMMQNILTVRSFRWNLATVDPEWMEF